MTSWLLQTLGMSDMYLEHWDRVHLGVQRWGWLAAGLVLIIPAGWWITRRHQRNLPGLDRFWRGVLTACRVVILMILFLIIAGPYATLDLKREQPPIVALVWDHSSSMNLPSGPFLDEERQRILKALDTGETPKPDGAKTPDQPNKEPAHKELDLLPRSQLGQRIWEVRSGTLLKDLSARYDIRTWTFSQAVNPQTFDVSRPPWPLPPVPGGDVTHLGDSLKTLLEEYAGQPLCGIVVMTDGENTGGFPPLDAARAAADAKAPIFPVPIGTASRLKDIALIEVFAPGEAAVGDTVPIAVTLGSQGFDGVKIPVQLRDGETVLESKELTLNSVERQYLEFTYRAAVAGTKTLSIHIPPHGEELPALHANNTELVTVAVSGEKLRLLYADGVPRWDYRFIKNALRRDHALGGRKTPEPDVLLENDLKALPITADELAEYHTIILGDINPQNLPPGFLDALVIAVRERGVGLIVEAGPRFTPHKQDARLRDLLPVRFADSPVAAAAGSDAPGVFANANVPFPLEATTEGCIHPITRLYDDPVRNRRLWEQMPGYFWCAAAERPAPGASVLLSNPTKRNEYGKLPIVAAHYAGKGKVVFVGMDATWLWRRYVGDRFFDKFWGQTVRYVARSQTADPQSSLKIAPQHLQLGNPAQIEVFAYGSDHLPIIQDHLELSISGPLTKPVNIPTKPTDEPKPDPEPEPDNETETSPTLELPAPADRNVPGRYVTTWTPGVAGTYTVRVQPDPFAAPLQAQLQVTPPRVEFRNPNVNRNVLRQIAEYSGGALLEPDEIGQLRDRLQGVPRREELHRETTLWDNPLMFILLTLVYSVDIAVRRFTGNS